MRRSPFTAGRMRWGVLALVASLAALFMVASGAQAAVVNDQGTLAGVAMIPGTNAPAGLPVTASGQCQDPWLESDLGGPLLPSTAICYRGGGVAHSNEPFVLTWDPKRLYWSTTRNFLEQFLRDV